MKLTLSDVAFEYPSVPVLRDVSFALEPAEMIAIVGKNGSGKSTLMKCVNRLLSARSGSIVADGREVGSMTRGEIARTMAYHPQKTFYHFPITVFDVVLMGRYPYAGSEHDHEGEARVWEVLELLGLKEIALRDYDRLSGGQQQKVIMARALAQEARILLLDEPTSDLDIRYQLEVMGITRHLVKEKGLSAIVAIHDLNLAGRFCDRILMLSEGVITAAGTPREVLTPERIAAVYGVEASVYDDGGVIHLIPRRPLPAA